jgi:hypothetical protein
MEGVDRPAALERLEPLVGKWTVDAEFPEGRPAPPSDARARVVFEWALDRQFLLQWSEAPDPIPDSLSFIGIDAGGHEFIQHYFDSRGVARVYAMTFDDGLWTLTRERPDFTPLDFSQRWTAKLEDDGSTIRGQWEICEDGTTWETDFDLIYTRT